MLTEQTELAIADLLQDVIKPFTVNECQFTFMQGNAPHGVCYLDMIKRQKGIDDYALELGTSLKARIDNWMLPSVFFPEPQISDNHCTVTTYAHKVSIGGVRYSVFALPVYTKVSHIWSPLLMSHIEGGYVYKITGYNIQVHLS